MHKTSIPQSAIERGHLMRPPLRIDPRKTAALAIDFQRFFIDDGQPMGNPHARDILCNANRLHHAVRASGGLVIFTQHSMISPGELALALKQPAANAKNLPALAPGSTSYDIHPDVTRHADDLVIVKHQSSPLHPKSGTCLNEILQERGIETIIITGLVTNGCCDTTTRDAFQHGYRVVVASDATAAMSDEEHNSALLSLVIYYADVLDVDAIAAALSENP